MSPFSIYSNQMITSNFCLFLNELLPVRLKAITRQEASRRDRIDFTKTEKDIG